MVQKIFNDIFNADPLVVRSSVPIRLLGEYNLYNDGCLLTTTVNKHVLVAVSKRADGKTQLFSAWHLEKIELAPNDIIDIHKTGWAKPVLTVLNHIHHAGHPVQGVNILIDTGGVLDGVAYGAALEAALYTALNELFSLHLSATVIRSIACASFDPDFYTCLFGKRGYALKLDTRTGSHEYIPLRLTELSMSWFILGNRSPVAATVYRDRLCALEEVVLRLQKTDTTIQSLRDCTLPMLYTQINDAEARRRAAFIIRENTRVIAAATNLQTGNYKGFMQKLTESDDGLMKEYETGSPEADWLTEEMGWNEHLPGYRRLTGPFRHTVIGLLRAARTEEILAALEKTFEKNWNKKLAAEILVTATGTERVHPIMNHVSEANNRIK